MTVNDRNDKDVEVVEAEVVEKKETEKNEPIKADLPADEKKKNKLLVVGFVIFGLCFLLLVVILTLLRSIGVINN